MSVAVIVLSYNRPRWLAEALESIKGAAQIVIADDGSDFDVAQVARSYRPDLVLNPRISVEQRMNEPRQGKLFNRALRMVQQPYVTYLCDDDLFALGWIPSIEACFKANPRAHMVRGDWHRLGTTEDALPPHAKWLLTTGNFAHRTACAHVCGSWWNESAPAVQDVFFLQDYLLKHRMKLGGSTVPHTGTLAGWRREHAYNMLAYTDGVDYTPSAETVLRQGFLEPVA